MLARDKIGPMVRRPPPFPALKLHKASEPSAILVTERFFLDFTKTSYFGAVVRSEPKLCVNADICYIPPMFPQMADGVVSI